MDQFLKKATEFIRKYRYAVLILLLGIVLLMIPTGEKGEQPVQQVQQEQDQDLAEQLAQILSSIDGVGKAEVMLTVQTGQITVYQYDEDGTVIVTDEQRAQNGLVERTEAESYRGAIVVCQGADRPQVRLNVIDAVSKVTGLSSDRITVLKMK